MRSTINKTDSNWKAGHPSVGLAQVIASTFAANVTSALRNVGPFAYGVSEDPTANIVAGARYGVKKYGSLENIPGVVAVNSGKPYVGYDEGGYLQPGVTMAINNTGKPEPIFTSAQAAALAGAATSSSAAFPDRVTLVDADGSILAKTRVQTAQALSRSDRGTAGIAGAGFPGAGGGLQPRFGRR
jgi:SLT domain-containing protein